MAANMGENPSAEKLLAAGDIFHRQGDHERAKHAWHRAFVIAPDDSLLRGNAAACLASSLGHVGPLDEGLYYAGEAVRIHGRLCTVGQDEPAIREYRASVGTLATLELKKALIDENGSHIPWQYVDRARNHLEESLTGPEDDQFTINFVGRYAILLAMYGKRREAHTAAKRAWALGGMSEARELPYSNPDLTDKERAQAQRRAKHRAAGAFVLNMLSPKPYTHEGSSSLLRYMARNVARRII